MKNCFGLILLAFIGCMLCSCGHNQGIAVVGKGVIIGGSGLQYYNGIAIFDNSRENSSWKFEVSDEDTANSTAESASDVNVKGVKSITRTIHNQVTGNLVELAEQSPEAVVEYLKAADSADMNETSEEETKNEGN